MTFKIVAHVKGLKGEDYLSTIFRAPDDFDDLYTLYEAISPKLADTQHSTTGFEFDVAAFRDAKMDGSTINGLGVDRNVAHQIYAAQGAIRGYEDNGATVTLFAMDE